MTTRVNLSTATDVEDFNRFEDRIELQAAMGFTSFEQLMASNSVYNEGANLGINFAGFGRNDWIVVKNMQKEWLAADDFVFI
jgi:hypothetical protein